MSGLTVLGVSLKRGYGLGDLHRLRNRSRGIPLPYLQAVLGCFHPAIASSGILSNESPFGLRPYPVLPQSLALTPYPVAGETYARAGGPLLWVEGFYSSTRGRFSTALRLKATMPFSPAQWAL